MWNQVVAAYRLAPNLVKVGHLTTAPLLLVLLVVPLFPVVPLLVVPFLLTDPPLPFPPSEGVHEPPGRPTQLFGWCEELPGPPVPHDAKPETARSTITEPNSLRAVCIP